MRRFLDGLLERRFDGVAAAALDTRMGTPTPKNASEAEAIAGRLEAANCRLVAPPESFLVAGFRGPLVEGEEERATRWTLAVTDRAAVTTA